MDYSKKKKKISEFLKSPKYEGELKGTFRFSLKWPVASDLIMLYQSDKFDIGGNTWALNVHPMGVHEESGFLSIYLVNKSEREVFASYKLTLKNQGIGEDLVWVDPEKLVSFSGANTGDNMWGNDEFIELSELDESSDFTRDGKVDVEVAIEVFGREHLIENVNIEDIEKSASKVDLVMLAKGELADVISRLPMAKDATAQGRMEDRVHRARGK